MATSHYAMVNICTKHSTVEWVVKQFWTQVIAMHMMWIQMYARKSCWSNGEVNCINWWWQSGT
jgi:hypothetical protein